MTGETAPPEVTVEQIDAILQYLAVFEEDRYVYGRWVTPEGQFPYYAYSPEVEAFVRALYRNNMIVVFDWSSWGEEVQRYRRDHAGLETADLLIVRKLLTAHVRADRFVEGHLGTVLEEGHVTAILRRLRQIRDQMAE